MDLQKISKLQEPHPTARSERRTRTKALVKVFYREKSHRKQRKKREIIKGAIEVTD